MASIDSILKQLKPIDGKSKIDLLVDILEERHTIVDVSIEKKVLNGMVLNLDTNSDLVVVFNKNNRLLAIYTRYDKDFSKMKPYKVFKETNYE